MEKPVIGIRQADGSFYEIMGDAQSGHKRLVLSAARTDQHGVRIDLFRSLDGAADPEGALGSITLDDPEGLGYQDIEFRVDLDAEGQLLASAKLPGQAPQTLSVDLTPFRHSDETLALADDLPAVDFDDLDTPPMTLDLPDVEVDSEPPRRSDTDILEDESFALADLDTLDDFSFDDTPAEEAAPLRSDNDILGDEAFASADLDTLDDFSFEDRAPEASPAASFDLGDLDAGFGEPAPAAGNPAEEWEKISLDDMEPMEFLDTGAEISAPPKPSTPKASSASEDPFRIDHDEPLELGDFDSDFSDLPDMGDVGDSSPSFPAPDLDPDFGQDNDLDQDFLAPPALTESSPWDQDEPLDDVPPPPVKGTKPAKAALSNTATPRSEVSIDKMSLILSLAALSLLVFVILVLLFLNMIKAPQPPVIQPEVQRWKASSLAAKQAPVVGTLDLGATEPTVLEAQSVLEVPVALRTARVSLSLEPGETVEDASRRFGEPATAQGNQLSW